MPELPEVETIVRELREELKHTPQITRVQLMRSDLRVKIPIKFATHMVGQTLQNIRRRAKYLLFDTEDFTIVSHLGMSGSWRLIKQKSAEHLKHDHCMIKLSDGRELVYHDPRRFGLIDLCELNSENKSKWLKHLGPEPFDDQLSPDYFCKLAKNKTVAVKNFIMNQEVIVGVGNIYASEALFHAQVRPLKKVSQLKLQDWQKLLQAIRKVLGASIKNGGTTLRDYRKASGEQGDNQRHLFVYDRAGEPCQNCKTTIKLDTLGGRSTYWCPSCQR